MGVLQIILETALALNISYGTMCKIAWVESGLDPSANNPTSSAKGLFQLTDATEASLRKKYFIYGSPYDARVSSVLAGFLIKEINKETALETYIYYFFGYRTANKILSSDINAKVKDIAPQAYRYNAGMIGEKTIKELIELFDRKLKGAYLCPNYL